MPDTNSNPHLARLEVTKTYKLLIDGKFPRSESGRSTPVADIRADGNVVAHVCRASRKDLREAVEAARRAQPGWAAATAYLRGQILYRMAEMLEGKKNEFADALAATLPQHDRESRAESGVSSGIKEVESSIDRLIAYAGWADKYSQVLGCNNPVAGPYYNFTVPEPTGVVVAIAPDQPPLLALVSLIAPVVAAGNTVVALGSTAHPLTAAVLGEVCATSDVPPGVINILTGQRSELLAIIASHRDVDAIHAGGLDADESALLRSGTAENIKRVTVHAMAPASWSDDHLCQSPWWIEPFVEMKTMWHPSAS